MSRINGIRQTVDVERAAITADAGVIPTRDQVAATGIPAEHGMQRRFPEAGMGSHNALQWDSREGQYRVSGPFRNSWPLALRIISPVCNR